VIDIVYIRWLYVEILSEGKEFYLGKDGMVSIRNGEDRHLWWGAVGCQELAKYLLNRE
jgi:hypothetical protein